MPDVFDYWVECRCGNVVVRKSENQVWCSAHCRGLYGGRQQRALHPLRVRFQQAQARFRKYQRQTQREVDYSGVPEWKLKIMEITGEEDA